MTRFRGHTTSALADRGRNWVGKSNSYLLLMAFHFTVPEMILFHVAWLNSKFSLRLSLEWNVQAFCDCCTHQNILLENSRYAPFHANFPPILARDTLGCLGTVRAPVELRRRFCGVMTAPAAAAADLRGWTRPSLNLKLLGGGNHPQWFQAILYELSPAGPKPLHGDGLVWSLENSDTLFTRLWVQFGSSVSSMFTVCRIPACFSRLVWRIIWTTAVHRCCTQSWF